MRIVCLCLYLSIWLSVSAFVLIFVAPSRSEGFRFLTLLLAHAHSLSTATVLFSLILAPYHRHAGGRGKGPNQAHAAVPVTHTQRLSRRRCLRQEEEGTQSVLEIGSDSSGMTSKSKLRKGKVERARLFSHNARQAELLRSSQSEAVARQEGMRL